MAKKVIVAIIVLAVLGGGAYLLMNKKDKPADSTNNTPNSSNSASSDTSDNTKVTATIEYSDDGFSPNSLTVKAGDTVTIKNTSSHDMQFDSDPHPVHTDDPDLNVGVVAPGQSMSFTPTKKGTYGYHNHLNPSDTGTIIIE